MNNFIQITPSKGGVKLESKVNCELFNEDWFLSPKGDMYESHGRYEIGAYSLKDDDWILHLMDKTWFDANTFIPAYFAACQKAGIKLVEIRTSY